MKIARVFPRKTEATPRDELAFIGGPGNLPELWPEVDGVHISVTFTKDKRYAENLAEEWSGVAPVSIGGPAYDDKGKAFVPGMYLRRGFVITSRGCPNQCWYCDVWTRSGDLAEYEIKDGWIIQDDNLLACSESHIRAVFDMLHEQKYQGRSIEFKGGMEARLLKEWHVGLLWGLRPKQIFFAYDKSEDLEPLIKAGEMLRYADFTRSHLRCYVLVGYPDDTMAEAVTRLLEAWSAGFLPYAMLYMAKDGRQDSGWGKFARTWMRPPAMKAEIRRLYLRGNDEA